MTEIPCSVSSGLTADRIISRLPLRRLVRSADRLICRPRLRRAAAAAAVGVSSALALTFAKDAFGYRLFCLLNC